MDKLNLNKLTFGILATVIGIALFKQIDFENLRFQKTGMGIIYLIGFAASIFLLLKNEKNKE
jgi:predicted ferric reductase